MCRKVNLIIADDHPDFIEGVKLFLNSKTNFEIVGTANDGYELLNHPFLSCADILLIDCEMPVINGIEAAKRLDFLYPHIKMIAVTMHREGRNLYELLSVGFKGYLYKPDIGSKIESVIEKVLNNEYAFDRNLDISKYEKPKTK